MKCYTNNKQNSELINTHNQYCSEIEREGERDRRPEKQGSIRAHILTITRLQTTSKGTLKIECHVLGRT